MQRIRNIIKLPKKVRLGFTLAEVLITLGIIGVVASLTIPILNQNIQTEKFRSAIKKEYSALNQAINTIIANNGDLDLSSTANFVTDLSNAMKVSKTGTWASITSLPSSFYYHCYKESSGHCGDYMYRPGQDTARLFVTSSGVFYFVMNASSSCSGANWHSHTATEPNPTNNLCSEFRIDVNGDAPPNQLGVDLHQIHLVKTNDQYLIKPSNMGVVSCAKSYPENANYALGCTYLMIYDRTMP